MALHEGLTDPLTLMETLHTHISRQWWATSLPVTWKMIVSINCWNDVLLRQKELNRFHWLKDEKFRSYYAQLFQFLRQVGSGKYHDQLRKTVAASL